MTLVTAEHLSKIHRERHARLRLEEHTSAAAALARDLCAAIGRWVTAVAARDPISASVAGIAIASLMPGRAALWSTWAAAHAEWARAAWELEAADLEAPFSQAEVADLLAELIESDGCGTENESVPEALDRLVDELENSPEDMREQLLSLHREALGYEGAVSVIWCELRNCGGWEQLEGIVPAEACRVIFRDLLVYPAEYQRNREGEIAQHLVARRKGREFRREILATQASPGLSQEERALLLELLDKLEKRGADKSWAVVNAMPDRPGGDTTGRIFTVRRLAREFSKYTNEPLHAAIARLTEAALHLNARTLGGADIKSALKDWSRPAWQETEG